jgi:hypothetical protein
MYSRCQGRTTSFQGKIVGFVYRVKIRLAIERANEIIINRCDLWGLFDLLCNSMKK